MDYTTLGRTGLRVSVAGLGGGGPSQLGQRAGANSTDESVAIVRRAIDRGVNFIDTAESYQTEAVIGRAAREAGRDPICLATKASCWHGTWKQPGDIITPAELAGALECSLTRLGTDRVEVYQLHALPARLYRRAVETLVPAMLKLRDQGKIRFIGVTEEFIVDCGHEMLQLAVRDDCWDTIMVGFNLLNQSARQRVFPATRARGIGTLIMFAVRRALSQPEKLGTLVAELAAQGRIDQADFDPADPLGFLLRDGVAPSLPDAAYRFCRHEPGCDVTLFGTGQLGHLEQNVASFLRPDLPPGLRARLVSLFARVDNVSGN